MYSEEFFFILNPIFVFSFRTDHHYDGKREVTARLLHYLTVYRDNYGDHVRGATDRVQGSSIGGGGGGSRSARVQRVGHQRTAAVAQPGRADPDAHVPSRVPVLLRRVAVRVRAVVVLVPAGGRRRRHRSGRRRSAGGRGRGRTGRRRGVATALTARRQE